MSDVRTDDLQKLGFYGSASRISGVSELSLLRSSFAWRHLIDLYDGVGSDQSKYV